jgi:hypothetical protein
VNFAMQGGATRIVSVAPPSSGESNPDFRQVPGVEFVAPH